MLQSKRRAGLLDREITIQYKNLSIGNANSDHIDGWNTLGNDWAQREDMPGDTVVVDAQITYVQRTNWIIRYRSDINVQMRIVQNGQVYNILSLFEDNSSRDRWLKIVTELDQNVTA